MLRYAVLGALLAGIFGVLHDQITFSISHEYFTRLKFSQFQYADFGLPPRVFVAEIGFLASWWVGFIAAWFIACITVPAFRPPLRFRYTLQGVLIVLACAMASSAAGCILGLLHGSDYSAWEDYASRLGIVDLPGFVRVAYIHNASYLGGLVGVIVAILYLRKLRTPSPPASLDGGITSQSDIELAGPAHWAGPSGDAEINMKTSGSIETLQPRSEGVVPQFRCAQDD